MISKKKVFAKIETDFSAEISNSDGFSAQKQVISKKKVFAEKKKVLRRIFRPKYQIQTIFPVLITATSSQLRLPNPFGGLFSFLDQKSASNALKTCDFAYFSGQWGGSSPPAPTPGYATGDTRGGILWYHPS